MVTVKYYNNSNRYMGWEKFNKNNILSYKSWLSSGNTLVIADKVFNSFSFSSLILFIKNL